MQTTTRLSIGLLMVLALALPAPKARASTKAGAPSHERDNKTLAQAKGLYNQGVSAYEAGRYAEAIELFLQADEAVPHAAYSYNIAVAYDDMGDVGRALRWYRNHKARSAGELVPDTDKAIERLQRALQERGVQQVSVFSNPPGATVSIDGQPVGITPWTGERPPGQHALELAMAGRQKLSRPFDLPTGRALDLAYDLAPSAGVGDAGDEQLQRRGTTPTIHLGTWVVLGSGVAALGGAGLYELGRKAAEEDARQASTQQEANDSHSLAQERGTAAQVLALVGGVLTVTGGVLLALDLRAPQQDRATRVCDRHDPILERLSLGCRAEQCGVVLGGRF